MGLLKLDCRPAIDTVVAQLGELRRRLTSQRRGVPFRVEVMGRVPDPGDLGDVPEIRTCLRDREAGLVAA
jgi:hypothetical protein